MALSESLEFILNANPSGAISAFQSVASASEKSLNSVQNNVGKIGASLAKFGAGGIGVGGLLTEIASGDIAAAGQLKAAISSAGETYSDFQDRIDKTVQSQVRFGNTDEQVNNALTALVSSFGDTNKALDQMQLVTDLAARKHISLGDAATIVAKAHGGAGRIFKEFNIQVGQNADGTKNYDAALTQLAQKLQGQAAASADTATGKFKALKAEVENIASEFGQRFGPAILAGSTILTAAGSATAAFAAIQGRLAERRAVATAAAERQAEADLQAAAAIEAEAAATTAALEQNAAYAASAGTRSFSDAEVASALQARQAAEAQALLSQDALIAADEAATVANTELAASETAAAAGANTAKTSLASLAVPIAAGIVAIGGLVKAFGEIRDGGVHVSTDVHKMAQSTNDDLLRTYNTAKTVFGGAGLPQLIDNLKNSGQEGVGTLQRMRDALAATGGDTRDLDAALADAKSAQDNMNDSVNAGSTALGTAAPKLDDYAKGLQALVDQANRTEDAINATATATHQLLDANLQTQFAPVDIGDAQARAAEAQDKLTEAQQKGDPKEIAQATRDHDRAVLDVTRAVNNAAAAQENLRVQQNAANGIVDNAITKNGYLVQGLRDMEKYLQSQYIPTVDAEAASLQTVNDKLAAQFNLQEALKEQTAGNNKAGDLSSLTSQNYQITYDDAGNPIGIQHRAAGGSLGAHALSEVNETGLEMYSSGGRSYLLTGDQSGYVWNPSQTADQLSRAGGSSQPTITVEQNFYGQVDDTLVQRAGQKIARRVLTALTP